MGLILDTSVLIAVERTELAWDKFIKSVEEEQIFMAAITLSELWHGCHRATGAIQKKRLGFVEHIQSLIPVLPFAPKEALVHSALWAGLEKKRERIGWHDLLIASTALAQDCSVATLNEKEFDRIPNLKLIRMNAFLPKSV